VMAAREMRMEPARIHRCGLSFENNLPEVCMALLTWGLWTEGPRRPLGETISLGWLRSNSLTTLAGCYA
jgi:hypothetical protein